MMVTSVSEKLIPVVDLGGSKIIAALVSYNGEIIAEEHVATLAEQGPNAVIDRMLATLKGVISKANLSLSSPAISRLVIASAGAIDKHNGIVTSSPNLPGWQNITLKETVEKEMGREVLLINDASAAAIGEHRFGAGRGVDNLIYVTVSTGIGGGIITDGKLYTGVSGSAGEIGHMCINLNGPHCSCGNIGCLESLASGKAIAREAQRRITQGTKSLILELAEGEIHNINARIVSDAARRGDTLAIELISQVATYLGIGLVNLVNIFNPEMIIIGGGMSQMGEMLLSPARQIVEERAYRLPAEAVQIVPSELGDYSSILGSVAFLQLDEFNSVR